MLTRLPGAVIGAAKGLAWDVESSISSQLPYLVLVTPYFDDAPSFWYAGERYQSGWERTIPLLDGNGWYERLLFRC